MGQDLVYAVLYHDELVSTMDLQLLKTRQLIDDVGTSMTSRSFHKVK